VTEGATAVDGGVLEALRALDTPTVCNALEGLLPKRRGTGFTVSPLVCIRPELGSVVGWARTATIRAMHPSDLSREAARRLEDDYYRYVDAGPKPALMVVQDLDGDRRGYGAFWGEVNSHIHQGLGCVGLVTDGSVRDLPQIAEGFQILADRVGPSHAFVHPVGFGAPVSVAGMRVSDGDLVHMDRHGAVVVPADVASRVPEAAAAVARREAVIIRASREPGFDAERLREAIADAEDVH
jgi:regulator of RNase E activity RraA